METCAAIMEGKNTCSGINVDIGKKILQDKKERSWSRKF
jgi:hypothetical protein